MNAPNPRSAFIPPGWATPFASRKRLQLLPAEMFNRTFERAPDEWLHVAPLRRPPLILTIAFALITLMCGWIVWGVLTQAGTTPSMQGPMPYVIAVMFGILGLFSVLVFLNLLAASRSRASWGNRQCVAVGRSGIAVRFQGAAVNIPWNDVTAIWATTTNATGASQARLIKTPVLRIERDTGDGTEGVVGTWNIAPFALDAAPQATYAALHFYWVNVGARGELGTTLAQQRIDGFAGYAPTTVAPRG
ncbi:hypothetical protein NS220_16215 [Microbacterium testaceum]|uniref:Uncharacterized protein n=1 Tax=Microbacterium testaceum TaxID=2033 RepID=A0A147EU10_MICTE|nr:hypothetical protein [Microbacterium testaceum]KTR88553.1 hypothetical protein NS220_16215 [Microbacterium testaceum]